MPDPVRLLHYGANLQVLRENAGDESADLLYPFTG
jgi:hypothetical protein